MLYNAACHFARASAGAADDAEVRERYADCAVRLLTAAESRNRFGRRVDVEHLERDPDLESLRQRPDFLALVARVEQTLAATRRPTVARVAPPPGPYARRPASVPGVVQAEHYDEGGEAVGYHDIDDQPALCRPARPTRCSWTNARIGAAGITSAGSLPGNGSLTRSRPSITPPPSAADQYTLAFRVASPTGGGTLHVEFDGMDKTGPVVIPKTGGWQQWQTVSSKPVRLKAGRQVMRVVFDTAGKSVWPCNLNWIKLQTAAATPAAQAGASTQATRPTIEQPPGEAKGEQRRP